MPKRKKPGKRSGNLLIAQQKIFSDNPHGEVLTKEKDSRALIEKMVVEEVKDDSCAKESPSNRGDVSNLLILEREAVIVD